MLAWSIPIAAIPNVTVSCGIIAVLVYQMMSDLHPTTLNAILPMASPSVEEFVEWSFIQSAYRKIQLLLLLYIASCHVINHLDKGSTCSFNPLSLPCSSCLSSEWSGDQSIQCDLHQCPHHLVSSPGGDYQQSHHCLLPGVCWEQQWNSSMQHLSPWRG